ncbi:hypothetical protein C5167_035133 [Papaver somniferum]|uniref:Uncharacterized protein n=1 Tax=Papaver somniferum TaxID=3469 RepID=A0A4Y7KFZ3_PAPSO|nr:hypothetical protein C5167_035133 [Papaver somniferum]
MQCDAPIAFFYFVTGETERAMVSSSSLTLRTEIITCFGRKTNHIFSVKIRDSKNKDMKRDEIVGFKVMDVAAPCQLGFCSVSFSGFLKLGLFRKIGADCEGKNGVFGKGMREGNKGMKVFWLEKGANLAEMAAISLSVSPGLTISTEACKDYHSWSVTTEKNKLTEAGETCKR